MTMTGTMITRMTSAMPMMKPVGYRSPQSSERRLVPLSIPAQRPQSDWKVQFKTPSEHIWTIGKYESVHHKFFLYRHCFLYLMIAVGRISPWQSTALRTWGQLGPGACKRKLDVIINPTTIVLIIIVSVQIITIIIDVVIIIPIIITIIDVVIITIIIIPLSSSIVIIIIHQHHYHHHRFYRISILDQGVDCKKNLNQITCLKIEQEFFRFASCSQMFFNQI